MSDYDTDVVSWSEHQAALLRRRAVGEMINDVELDWPHIAEEIESVGRSERSALASHVGTVIEHLLKLQASPEVEPRAGWKETVIRAGPRSRIRWRKAPVRGRRSTRPSLGVSCNDAGWSPMC